MVKIGQICVLFERGGWSLADQLGSGLGSGLGGLGSCLGGLGSCLGGLGMAAQAASCISRAWVIGAAGADGARDLFKQIRSGTQWFQV